MDSNLPFETPGRSHTEVQFSTAHECQMLQKGGQALVGRLWYSWWKEAPSSWKPVVLIISFLVGSSEGKTRRRICQNLIP